MTTGVVAAVDLGASSGRVHLGYIGRGILTLDRVSRFRHDPVRLPDGLHWTTLALYREVLAGLADAVRREPELASIGIDSWAVDYALLRAGRMLGAPYSYRDERRAGAVDAVHATVPADELYARNGLQHLPFNSVFQLAADRDSGMLDLADSLLMLPDLFAFWLTSQSVTERTNASTTGLVNIATGEWDTELMGRLGIRPEIFSPLVDAGSHIGELNESSRVAIGSGMPRVTAVGSHDTASAVVAVPATNTEFAYISSGTWSLVGVELERPVISEAGRRAGFSNESGVDGRVRYLHNVMGLWLLNECVRAWESDGIPARVDELVGQAGEVHEPVPLFDVDDPSFIAPGDMPGRIAAWLRSRDLPVPGSRPALVRSILASLADAYARSLRGAVELSGHAVTVVHIVGGGSQNALLCQLTADATGLPVVAGPVEATTIGNVLVQGRALGYVSGDLEALRSLVSAAFPLTRYEPR